MPDLSALQKQQGQSTEEPENGRAEEPQEDELASLSLLALLQRFVEVQARRVQIYQQFESGFLEYVRTGQELAYRQLCEQVTRDFSGCSKQVIGVEAALKDPGRNRPDLATILRVVQENEREKLRMTAILQVLRKAGRPSERPEVDGSASHQGHQCGASALAAAGYNLGGLETAQEETEYLAAVGEATQAIQTAVTGINEKMEEIRYEMADLQED